MVMMSFRLGSAYTFRRFKPLGMMKGCVQYFGKLSRLKAVGQPALASMSSMVPALPLFAMTAQPSSRPCCGCAGPSGPMVCAACCSGMLDTGASHESFCAISEAIRRHHAVVNLVHEAAKNCGRTAETEVIGLASGTDLRPAVRLTSALSNSLSVCSPPRLGRWRGLHQHHRGNQPRPKRSPRDHFPVPKHRLHACRVADAHRRPDPNTLTVLQTHCAQTRSYLRYGRYMRAGYYWCFLRCLVKQVPLC